MPKSTLNRMDKLYNLVTFSVKHGALKDEIVLNKLKSISEDLPNTTKTFAGIKNKKMPTVQENLKLYSDLNKFYMSSVRLHEFIETPNGHLSRMRYSVLLTKYQEEQDISVSEVERNSIMTSVTEILSNYVYVKLAEERAEKNKTKTNNKANLRLLIEISKLYEKINIDPLSYSLAYKQYIQYGGEKFKYSSFLPVSRGNNAFIEYVETGEIPKQYKRVGITNLESVESGKEKSIKNYYRLRIFLFIEYMSGLSFDDIYFQFAIEPSIFNTLEDDIDNYQRQVEEKIQSYRIDSKFIYDNEFQS